MQQRREPAVIDVLIVLLLLGSLVIGGIGWTAWDVFSDLRRHRLK